MPVRQDIKESLERYANHGIEPGGFLRAVLENDLKGAMGRADDYNRASLFEIVSIIYNQLPAACQGSPEKVAEWIGRGGMVGYPKETQ